MIDISINHEVKTPIYIQIATEFKHSILMGNIPAGCLLPSERTLAKQLQVHRNTVVKAYNELKAEGFITSNQGKGYVVEGKQVETFEPGYKEKKVNWSAQIKDEYQDIEFTFDNLYQYYSDPKIISLGSGLAAPENFDVKKISSDIGNIINYDGKDLYFYSPYQGDKGFRKQLVSFLSSKGINASASEIQIMNESNQAFDFLVSLLLQKGDCVIMEEPVSPDIFRAVELAGGRIITVPTDAEGIRVDALELMIVKYKPRFIYVNSSFSDPTGVKLTDERKRQLIEVSNKYRAIIIEDDHSSELAYDCDRRMPLKAYDRLNNVIYIYSFQMTVMPGISTSFIVADKKLIRSLSNLTSVRLVSTNWLPQKLLCKYLEDGTYYKMLSNLREAYASKRDLMSLKLDAMKQLGVEYIKPEGGVYIWCRLPDAVDSKALTQEGKKRGISLLPGYVFFPKRNGGRNYIRLNYSFETHNRISKGMDIMEQLIKEQLERKK